MEMVGEGNLEADSVSRWECGVISLVILGFYEPVLIEVWVSICGKRKCRIY
jgi:hypothetical protein